MCVTRWRRALSNPLPARFYDRPADQVARDVLGTVLVHRTEGGRFRAARIVETEAYVEGDPANHAFRGLTRKNWSMFTGPGHLYVYRIHQVHCTNVTTRPGEAVLLRAALPLTDPGDRMYGPGLLSRALSLTKTEDGEDLVRGSVRLLPGGRGPREVVVTRRIGIREGRDLPLRFVDMNGAVGVSRSRSRSRRGGPGPRPLTPSG